MIIMVGCSDQKLCPPAGPNEACFSRFIYARLDLTKKGKKAVQRKDFCIIYETASNVLITITSRIEERLSYRDSLPAITPVLTFTCTCFYCYFIFLLAGTELFIGSSSFSGGCCLLLLYNCYVRKNKHRMQIFISGPPLNIPTKKIRYIVKAGLLCGKYIFQ